MKHDCDIWILVLVCVVGLLSGCSNQAEENKAVIRRWYEDVWNKGDLVLVDELVKPKTNAPVFIAAIKQSIQARRTVFPDIRFFIQDMVVEKNKVATRWVAHATHQGALGEVPPTGRQITVFGISIGVVQAGKIIGMWESWDALGALVQIGAVPEELNMSRRPLQQEPAAPQSVK